MLAAVLASLLVAQDDVPNFWVLLHTGDGVAKERLLKLTDFAEARTVASELGYEAVVEKKIAYFFPVPAWSSGRANTLMGLIEASLKGGFDQHIELGHLPAGQQAQLRRFLAEVPVGGELGDMARRTDLKLVRLTRRVDVKIEFDGRSAVVPFGAGQLAPHLSAGIEPPAFEAPESKDYPDRKELYAFGTEEFAMSVMRPISVDLFSKIHDRAKAIFAKRRAEVALAAKEGIDAAFADVCTNELGKKLKDGGSVAYRDMPPGLRSSFLESARRNPGAFGLTAGDIEAQLASARFSIPENGFRMSVGFMLDGTRPASDGTPIGYSISWNAVDFMDGG